MKQDGNSQPCVFSHPLLHGVRELRYFARAGGDFTGPRHFSDAIFQQNRRPLRKKRAFVIHKSRFRSLHELLVLPNAFELRDFFFQRHPRKQIGKPLLDRKFRIAVGENLLRLAGEEDRAANGEHRRSRRVPAEREKKPSSKPPRKNTDTCNPKNGWYYSTAVNVHGESFLHELGPRIEGLSECSTGIPAFPAPSNLRRASVSGVCGKMRPSRNWG